MSCFIIAEAGVNHNGSLDLALRLVEAASEVGADAVKFQTFCADDLVIPGAGKASYQKEQTGNGDQYGMLKQLELSVDAYDVIVTRCNQLGIEFMSTAFDSNSLDLLVSLGVRRLKIPSGEITNFPLIHAHVLTNLPIILSTGMSTLAEVSDAVGVITKERGSNPDLTLLHCTSNYPAPLQDVHLNAMHTLKNEFGFSVGYSDHTQGILAALAAVAAGGEVIEKHLTLDRGLPGPDHQASIEPDEMRELVKTIREIEVLLGSHAKQPTEAERTILPVVRRSVFVRRRITAGEIVSKDDLILLRPGIGIPPRDLDQVIGCLAKMDMEPGHMLAWEELDTTSTTD